MVEDNARREGGSSRLIPTQTDLHYLPLGASER